MTQAPATRDIQSNPFTLWFKPLNISIPSDFDLQSSVEKLAAARARLIEDVQTRAMPVGQVSTFSVSLRWATPFAKFGSQVLFDGHFEQRDSGVVLEGRFTGHLQLIPGMWAGVVLYQLYQLWQHTPPLFTCVIVLLTYVLTAAFSCHMLLRPAQRHAALLTEAMQKALQREPLADATPH